MGLFHFSVKVRDITSQHEFGQVRHVSAAMTVLSCLLLVVSSQKKKKMMIRWKSNVSNDHRSSPDNTFPQSLSIKLSDACLLHGIMPARSPVLTSTHPFSLRELEDGRWDADASYPPINCVSPMNFFLKKGNSIWCNNHQRDNQVTEMPAVGIVRQQASFKPPDM